MKRLRLARRAARARAAARRVRRSSRAGNRAARCLEYAADTWHSFDADDRPGDRASRRQRLGGGRAREVHVADEHRRLHLEHARRPRPRHHHAGRGASPHRRDAATRSRRSSARHGQFYNWYDPDTGARLPHVARQRRAGLPFLSSVDNGWLADGAADGRATPCRSCRARRAAIVDADGLRLLLRPGTRARCAAARWTGAAARAAASRDDADGRLVHVPPLRHAEHRAADRDATSGSRSGQVPPSTTSGCSARSPTRATGTGRRCSRTGVHAHVPRRQRLRGPLHLPRHEHRPELGRLDVRGADGAAARARGGVGAAELGRQPPALRARADRARPAARRSTATGASRPRTTRPAATASTASTRSA